jgi:hypothetical protein
MDSTDQIELGNSHQDWSSHPNEQGHIQRIHGSQDWNSPNEVEQSSLPPVDGGKDAWLFLAACFMLEANVWVRKIAVIIVTVHNTNTISGV